MTNIPVYAGRQLGAYGWPEKPWYVPGRRLDAFLAEVERRDLPLRFVEAGPATDADLHRIHPPEHVAWVTARCATNEGSLDRAPDRIVQRTRRLLRGIADDAVEDALDELDSTLDDWVGFLASEGLASGEPIRLTDAGRAWLADPEASLGGPTYARRDVEIAARWVCGAVLDATRRVAAGELPTAFVPISGFHHAHAAEARLYCLYNDPALAVAAALDATGGPVAYIDVDIHHGDGVWGIFADDPRVTIVDLHEDPQGRPTHRRVEGSRLAIALGPRTEDADYIAAWEEAESFVRAARPAFVVFEAGVDGLEGDPMSNQAITPAALREVARRVARLAGGRLVVLGGGGYDYEGTARGWAEVVEGLIEGGAGGSG